MKSGKLRAFPKSVKAHTSKRQPGGPSPLERELESLTRLCGRFALAFSDLEARVRDLEARFILQGRISDELLTVKRPTERFDLREWLQEQLKQEQIERRKGKKGRR